MTRNEADSWLWQGRELWSWLLFNVPFRRANIHKTVHAINEAALLNWDIERDEWTAPDTEVALRLDHVDAVMQKNSQTEGAHVHEAVDLYFSPVSGYTIEVSWVDCGGYLEMRLEFRRPKWVLCEDAGDRMILQLQKQWLDVLLARGDQPPQFGPPWPDVEEDEFERYEELRCKYDNMGSVAAQNFRCYWRVIRAAMQCFELQSHSIPGELFYFGDLALRENWDADEFRNARRLMAEYGAEWDGNLS